MTVAPTASTPRSHSRFLSLTRLFNRLVLPLAGTRLMPLYGVIAHRGRRSGKMFYTPVVVRPTPEGFVVPMPWGEGTDWCRNIRAAGGCVIRWKGRDYAMVEPSVVNVSDVGAAFNAMQRRGLQRFGIRQCLLMRYAG